MRNKKGFTLVELLAVVVIIAILMSLAIPNVTKRVTDSRKKSFLEEARTIVSTSKSNYASGSYEIVNGIDDSRSNRVIYSKDAIDSILVNKLGKSPFGSNYKDAKVLMLKTKDAHEAVKYEYYVCLIDEGGNGFDYTNEKDLNVNKLTFSENVKECTAPAGRSYNVDVTVYNGVVSENDSSHKKVFEGEDTTFNVNPSQSDMEGVVTCTNNQKGTLINNNVLKVSNVDRDTMCTVTYSTSMTVLYGDGTLIINEKVSNSSANALKHGKVLKKYPGFSNSNSYEFYGSNYQLWKDERNKVSEIEIDSLIKPSRTSYWFYGFEYMTSANLKNIDTSNVTAMNDMFNKAGSAESVGAFKLYGLDKWDTSKVKNMDSMFRDSGSAATVFDIGDISNWNTSNVTDLHAMFDAAGYNATTFNLDLSNWNVSNVKTLSMLFYQAGYKATNWSVGDLSSWNTSNVTDMFHVFRDAGHNAKIFDLGNLNNWDLSNVTDTVYMFCSAGTKATTWNVGDLSSWNTSNVTDMSGMFYWAGHSAPNWSIGDLSNWNISSAKKITGMFIGAGSNSNKFDIGDIGKWDLSNVEDLQSMFFIAGSNSETFNIGDLSNWKFPKVTSLRTLFYGAGSNASTFNIGDIGKWDVSNITNMDSLFDQAGELSSSWYIGDLSKWDVSNVTNMSSLFRYTGYNATDWSVGDLSSWNVSNVTDMHSMFDLSGVSATNFSIGDLSNWDTSKVTNMSKMFSQTGRRSTTWQSLGTLKVYADNTQEMFFQSYNATVTLNIYNKISNYEDMFDQTTTHSGRLIKVNYSSNVTDIDNIIATKSSNSNVIKGVQIN